MRLREFFFCFFILCSANVCFSQYVVDAGNDKTVCPGLTTPIGGSPTAQGGQPPYTYVWNPTTNLTGSTTANPICSPTSNITYTVTVTDDTGAVKTDFINIYMSILDYVDAGRDTSICENSNALIGVPANVGGITYSWAPSGSLSNSASGRPTASPGTSSVTYTLTATIAGCPSKTDNVTVSVIPTPQINAGEDQYIAEGELAILIANGGFYYAWYDGPTLTYQYSAECNAEPIVTTTYYLFGMDETRTCPGFDDVTIYVEASDNVVIYNTFTPNGDGINDTWYIGNIHKYPDSQLEVYNRYGKLVYKVSSYDNTWGGKAYGEDLPSGTYFYDLDLGVPGKNKYHGTITIVK